MAKILDGINVFFDNDATLVDSEIIAMPHAVTSVIRVMESRDIQHGIDKEQFDALVIKLAGKQISQMMKIMEARYGFKLSDAEMLELCQDDANRVIDALADVKLIDGIPELLEELSQSGAKMSVVTSSSLLRVIPGLINNDILKYFAGETDSETRVWSAAETLTADPRYGRAIPKSSTSPEIYEYAIGESGARQGNAVAIEDSASGVGAAIAAGIPVVGLTAASHILDKTAHATALREKVRDVLQTKSVTSCIDDMEVDKWILIASHPREIPRAIEQLLGIEPLHLTI